MQQSGEHLLKTDEQNVLLNSEPMRWGGFLQGGGARW